MIGRALRTTGELIIGLLAIPAMLLAAVALSLAIGLGFAAIWAAVMTVGWLLGGMDGSWIDAVLNSAETDCPPGEHWDYVGTKGFGPASYDVEGCVPD